ncbi:MAG: hypothetical protein KJ971_06890 [Firmicutes bacterium]|nr:hypothetical protein [Bacillota bacterium]
MYSNKILKKLILLVLIIPLVFLCIPLLAKMSPSTIESDSLPETETLLDETFLSSNQFTQADDLAVVNNFLTIPNTYILVGETDSLALYFEEESYAIRILNKADNFIYGSSLSTKDDNLENFNTTWEGIVNSAVTIKYYSYSDTSGVYTSLEESILKSNLTTTSYTLIENGFEVDILFGESGIGLTLRVFIEGEYLRVEVPNDSISEGDTFKLRSIKTYPFLGSVYGDSIPGYIFVPDGSGALIRYQPIDTITDIYEFRYYGTDEAISTSLEFEPNLAFPVSGMIQGINQHGFIAIVEDGALFANLVVSPAKNNLKYYYSYNEFLYRRLYQAPTSESQALSGSGRQVIQEDINSCNVALKYRFLADEEANYVGMAKVYQTYLLEESLMTQKINETDEVGIFLEVLGSEDKAGFIFDETIVLTDVSDLEAILDELSLSVNSIKVVYKGFSDGGFTSSGLVYKNLDSHLGTKQEFLDLVENYETDQIELYFYLDTMKVYENASFSTYRDITQKINQNLLKLDGFTKSYYYVSPTRVASAFIESVRILKEKELNYFAIGTIGHTIYSDYKDENNEIDRNEAMAIYLNMLEEADIESVFYQPFLYLLKYSNAYLITPTTSNKYRIYSDSVPFVSYVLSGILEAYAPFQNFITNQRFELLKMIDYHLYPSYILTQESSYLLQDTELQQIYSSSFSTWKSEIISQYDFINLALKDVVNASVLQRNYLDVGVYQVVYDNGVSIYINYTNMQQTFNLTTIEPLSYKVVTSND